MAYLRSWLIQFADILLIAHTRYLEQICIWENPNFRDWKMSFPNFHPRSNINSSVLGLSWTWHRGKEGLVAVVLYSMSFTKHVHRPWLWKCPYISLQYHHWLGGPGPRKTNMGSKTVPNRFNFSEMCFIPLVLFMRNWRQPPPVCLWPKWKLAAEHGWASLAFWPWCPAKYCHLMWP